MSDFFLHYYDAKSWIETIHFACDIYTLCNDQGGGTPTPLLFHAAPRPSALTPIPPRSPILESTIRTHADCVFPPQVPIRTRADSEFPRTAQNRGEGADPRKMNVYFLSGLSDVKAGTTSPVDSGISTCFIVENIFTYLTYLQRNILILLCPVSRAYCSAVFSQWVPRTDWFSASAVRNLYPRAGLTQGPRSGPTNRGRPCNKVSTKWLINNSFINHNCDNII